MTKYIFLFILLFSSVIASAQKSTLKEYLSALQIKDSDASKKVIRQTSFHLSNEYELYSFEKLSDQYFDTDISGVKGYKAIIFCEAKDGAQEMITDTFMVIMYYEMKTASWKVFDFRTKADPCYEASFSEEEINDKKFYTDSEFVYRNLGYWLMMCGKINEAEKAYNLADTEAKAKGIVDFAKEHLETIKNIR